MTCILNNFCCILALIDHNGATIVQQYLLHEVEKVEFPACVYRGPGECQAFTKVLVIWCHLMHKHIIHLHKHFPKHIPSA